MTLDGADDTDRRPRVAAIVFFFAASTVEGCLSTQKQGTFFSTGYHSFGRESLFSPSSFLTEKDKDNSLRDCTRQDKQSAIPW